MSAFPEVRVVSVDECERAHALAAGTARLDAVRELGEVLADPSSGRGSDDDVTLCDLTGVAVQDLVIARHVLRRRRSAWRRPMPRPTGTLPE